MVRPEAGRRLPLVAAAGGGAPGDLAHPLRLAPALDDEPPARRLVPREGGVPGHQHAGCIGAHRGIAGTRSVEREAGHLREGGVRLDARTDDDGVGGDLTAVLEHAAARASSMRCTPLPRIRSTPASASQPAIRRPASAPSRDSCRRASSPTMRTGCRSAPARRPPRTPRSRIRSRSRRPARPRRGCGRCGRGSRSRRMAWVVTAGHGQGLRARHPWRARPFWNATVSRRAAAVSRPPLGRGPVCPARRPRSRAPRTRRHLRAAARRRRARRAGSP